MTTFGQQCLALKNEGLTFQQIANRLHTTRNRVAGAIFRLKSPHLVKEYRQIRGLSKRQSNLAKIRKVRAGLIAKAELPRTERNRRILALFAEGRTAREIAEEFGISFARVGQIIREHCGTAYQHLGCVHSADAVKPDGRARQERQAA